MNKLMIFKIQSSLSLLIFFSIAVSSQILDEEHLFTVCPSQSQQDTVPDFEGETCYQQKLNQINPQNKLLWIKSEIKISEYLQQQNDPLALFIYGKASSKVYLNQQLLGFNGVPALTKQLETPGKMDTAFVINSSNINEDSNTLMIQLSAHHGFLDLFNPISLIMVSKYRLPVDSLLRHYWVSFLPFGVFILAAIYLSIWSFSHENKKSVMFLAFMSLFAAAQLIIETLRGTVSYEYPFHDIRLILITCCSFGFGLSLFSHVVNKFSSSRNNILILAALFITLIAIAYLPSFDMKAAIAIILPSILAGLLCLYWSFYRKPQAWLFMLALFIFAFLFILSPSMFLDRFFYYVVAALLLFLFAQQAVDFSKEKEQRISEKARADQLQLILNQKSVLANSENLKIKGAGKMELVPIKDIVYTKGAGDYVEIYLSDKNTILHSGSLKELEKSLPATFLKVHRSYIVNTTQIVSLERHSSGTGLLHLDNNLSIPVSRRIMPEVRKKLL